MSNEQKPSFIDLNIVFNTRSFPKPPNFFKRMIHGNSIWNYVDGRVDGTAAKEISFNVNEIARLADASPKSLGDFPLKPATVVYTKDGKDYYVQETRAEIKQKIAAALKP